MNKHEITLDEAIEHVEGRVEKLRNKAEYYETAGVYARGYEEGAQEWKQLAEWLKKLKQLQESCEDAISRQAVLDYIYNDLGLGDEENGNDVERQMELERSYKYVKSLPPVTPQLKTGYWTRELIRNKKGGCIGAKMICSECGNDNKHDEYMHHCPNCGAKMKSEE